MLFKRKKTTSLEKEVYRREMAKEKLKQAAIRGREAAKPQSRGSGGGFKQAAMGYIKSVNQNMESKPYQSIFATNTEKPQYKRVRVEKKKKSSKKYTYRKVKVKPREERTTFYSGGI